MARELSPLSQRFTDVEFEGSVRRGQIRSLASPQTRWLGPLVEQARYIVQKTTSKGHVAVELSAAVVGKV
jgi:hypothetical protein